MLLGAHSWDNVFLDTDQNKNIIFLISVFRDSRRGRQWLHFCNYRYNFVYVNIEYLNQLLYIFHEWKTQSINKHLPTSTVNMHDPSLPAASIAVHVTSVDTSMGNVLPDEGTHDTVGAALALSITTGSSHETGFVVVVIAAGQVITGTCWSKDRTVYNYSLSKCCPFLLLHSVYFSSRKHPHTHPYTEKKKTLPLFGNSVSLFCCCCCFFCLFVCFEIDSTDILDMIYLITPSKKLLDTCCIMCLRYQIYQWYKKHKVAGECLNEKDDLLNCVRFDCVYADKPQLYLLFVT